MAIFCKPAFGLGFTALHRWSRPLSLVGCGILLVGLFGYLEPGLSQAAQRAETIRRQTQPQSAELPALTVDGARKLSPYTSEIVTQNLSTGQKA